MWCRTGLHSSIISVMSDITCRWWDFQPNVAVVVKTEQLFVSVQQEQTLCSLIASSECWFESDQCPFLSVLFVLFPESTYPVHRGYQLSTQSAVFTSFMLMHLWKYRYKNLLYFACLHQVWVWESQKYLNTVIFLCVFLQTAVLWRLVFVSALQRHVFLHADVRYYL